MVEHAQLSQLLLFLRSLVVLHSGYDHKLRCSRKVVNASPQLGGQVCWGGPCTGLQLSEEETCLEDKSCSLVSLFTVAPGRPCGTSYLYY